MKFDSHWFFLFGVCVSSSTECSLCVPSDDLYSADSPSENWYRHRLPESLWLYVRFSLACLCCWTQKFNFLFYCSVQNDMKLISPVSHVFPYSVQFSLLSYCGAWQKSSLCSVVMLQSVLSCLSGLVFFICLSPSAETSIPVCEWKSFCLPVVCIEFLYPLVRLLLLARKQSKYNCSLSGPPRHWFIHSLLQVGVTNLRGSQPIHTTKI